MIKVLFLIMQIFLIVAPFVMVFVFLVFKRKERKEFEKRDRAMRPQIIPYIITEQQSSSSEDKP